MTTVKKQHLRWSIFLRGDNFHGPGFTCCSKCSEFQTAFVAYTFIGESNFGVHIQGVKKFIQTLFIFQIEFLASIEIIRFHGFIVECQELQFNNVLFLLLIRSTDCIFKLS